MNADKLIYLFILYIYYRLFFSLLQTIFSVVGKTKNMNKEKVDKMLEKSNNISPIEKETVEKLKELGWYE